MNRMRGGYGAEQAVLGLMMIDRESVGTVLAVFGRNSAECFAVVNHQYIFDVIVGLRGRSCSHDMIAVADVLRRLDFLDEIGGDAYLIQLVESYTDGVGAEHYARIVVGPTVP